MTTLKKLFWFSFFIKLAISALVPMTSDETYYWVWAQNLQLSYFDHPPFVAWLYWIGSHIDIWGGMVRWPGVALGQVTLALWLAILRPYFSEKQRVSWLLLALLSPLVGGSSLIVTPDLPLLFFNALALWVFIQWKERFTWRLALGLGLAMGLGFSSKYVMVLFPISLLPFVLLSPELRAKFFRQFGWVLLGGIIGTFPVWMWNIQNDFASIRFQLDHGLGRSAWKPRWTIEYILSQAALLFPVVVYWAIRGRKALPPFFNYLAWIPLGFFFLTTLKGYVEANWPIVAYPMFFALAVAAYPDSARGLKITQGIWALFLALLISIIIIRPPWAGKTKFKEFSQFDVALVKVKGVSPLYARSYQMAARLHFGLKRPIYKLKGINRRDYYDFLSQSVPVSSTYYVLAEVNDRLPKEFIERGDRIVETTPIDGVFELWKIEAP